MRSPLQLQHLDCGPKRHRTAAVVCARESGPVDVVAATGTAAGARADVHERAVLGDMRGKRTPGPFDRGTKGTVDPAETDTARHRGQQHRGRGLLPVSARLVDDLPPASLTPLLRAHRRY